MEIIFSEIIYMASITNDNDFALRKFIKTFFCLSASFRSNIYICFYLMNVFLLLFKSFFSLQKAVNYSLFLCENGCKCLRPTQDSITTHLRLIIHTILIYFFPLPMNIEVKYILLAQKRKKTATNNKVSNSVSENTVGFYLGFLWTERNREKIKTALVVYTHP